MSQKQTYTLWLLISVILILGVFFRTAQFATDRSLWLDEAMLALNIVDKSYVELTGPLDRNQGAPIGFLFIEKSFVKLFGNKDYILRIMPFLSGIAALFLMCFLSRHILGLRGTPLALGLFAVSTPLIYYASEVKQYSSDVALCLLLLLVSVKCLDEKANKKLFILLTIIGSVALMMSHSSIFIMTGVAACLGLDALSRRDKRRCLWLISVFSVWAGVFVALYFLSFRSLAANTALTGYWSSGFMPLPPWDDLAWFMNSFLRMLTNPVGLSTNLNTKLLATALLFSGCVSLVFRNWKIALLLLVPFVSLLLLSGFEKYPFKGRLILFLIPLVLILIGEGGECLYRFVKRYSVIAASIISVGLFVVLMHQPGRKAVKNLHNPNMREHIKPVLTYMNQNRQDTDAVYVYYGAIPAFDFYKPEFADQLDYMEGINARENPALYANELNKLSKDKRIWFVFSHNCSWCEVNEEQYYLEQLDVLGVRVDEFESHGSSVYAYELDSD